MHQPEIKDAAQPESAGRWMTILLAATALVAVVAPPTMIILVAGMLPTVMAALFGGLAKRESLPCLALLNLAGVIPVVMKLWHDDHSIETALVLLQDVYQWGLMLSGAVVALFVMWAAPQVVRGMLDARAWTEVLRIDSRRRKMVVEWGEDLPRDAERLLGRPVAVPAGRSADDDARA